MLAIYLSPIYILVNLYLFRWLLRWMGACHHFFQKKWMKAGMAVIYFILALSLLIGFLLPAGNLQRFFKSLGNYWLGVLFVCGFGSCHCRCDTIDPAAGKEDRSG